MEHLISNLFFVINYYKNLVKAMLIFPVKIESLLARIVEFPMTILIM